MRAAIGYGALVWGGAACVLGIVALGAGLRRSDDRLLLLGRRFVFAVLVAAVVAVAVMEWALLSHDFSLEYVAKNGSLATPVFYTAASLWASLEGSILLWMLILAGYLGLTAYRFRDRATDPLVAWATITGLAVALFFFILLLGPANPFRLVAGVVPTDGPGPNPLLQNHPLMAVHPPMLYLGYVGFTVPFMFAIAALVTGRLGEGWLIETRRAAVLAWGFLTVGIVLGGWWSYEVLGWGGYWAWDPVENASLLPWLTGTAYIHSVMVQERRGMLRVWNLSLLIATFCLTILGTFLTRSGVVNSVHSFSESAIGPMLLLFLGVVAVVGIGLIAWRGDLLRSHGKIDSVVSRESAFLANNLLFAAFAFVVLLGTVFPLLVEALQDRRLSVGEPYFDRMTLPIGMALLFLMAAAPALPWRATSGEVLQRRFRVPAWIGVLTMLVAVLLGTRGVAQVLVFGLAAFALTGIAQQFGMAVRSRSSVHGEKIPVALGRTVTGNPRKYGGLVVHVGVVLVAVAISVGAHWSTSREVRLGENESATVAGYTVTYLGSDTTVTEQKTTSAAQVRVERGGDDLGVYEPAISTFPNSTQGIGTPSVRTGITRDVYLTLISSPNESGRVTLGVAVNPMVVWLWIGGGVMFLGTLIAVGPSARSSLRRARRTGPSPDVSEPTEGDSTDPGPAEVPA
ncbi:MAG: heme lyase CcmF/NrfE family subunit [Acidimicrobiia bacterium]|nr:heme lyase CcmF/NrfE family subunit [Acidimicrobiia bacterium]